MSDNKKYYNYDYSYAIKIYNLDDKFKNFADYIKTYMIDHDLDPQTVRELCNLAILQAVKKQWFKE